MLRLRLAPAALTFSVLVACAPHVQAPPPELPPPPAPIAPIAAAPASTPVAEDDAATRGESTATSTTIPTNLPRPRPTGDRERDTLALGFWGCRVLARRIAPLATGKVVLRVRVGSGGDVLAITVWNDGVAQPVVQCLTTAVRATRFDPRGGEGSELAIPIDFASPGAAPSGVAQPPGNVSM